MRYQNRSSAQEVQLRTQNETIDDFYVGTVDTEGQGAEQGGEQGRAEQGERTHMVKIINGRDPETREGVLAEEPTAKI